MCRKVYWKPLLDPLTFSAVRSKKTVCANIKHNRYCHLTSTLMSIHSHGKRLYGHMCDIVDTAFRYWRALIICKFLHESSRVKESSLHVIWNAHIYNAFLLLGGTLVTPTLGMFVSVVLIIWFKSLETVVSKLRARLKGFTIQTFSLPLKCIITVDGLKQKLWCQKNCQSDNLCFIQHVVVSYETNACSMYASFAFIQMYAT